METANTTVPALKMAVKNRLPRQGMIFHPITLALRATAGLDNSI